MVVLKIEDRSNQNGPLDAHPGEVLDEWQVRLEIERAAAEDELAFVGGEPTLHPRLPHWLRACRETGHPSVVVTNGMRFSDAAYTRALATVGLGRAVVSLHMADERESDRLNQTPGAWKLTLQGIHTLLDHEIPVTIRASLCQINRHELPALIRLLSEEFDTSVPLVVELFAPDAGHPAEALALSLPEAAPALAEAVELSEKTGFSLRLADRNGPPLCLLPGKERFFDRYDAIREGYAYRPETGYVQGPPCASCIWSSRCSGVPESTVDRFGWEGILPVLKPPMDPGRGRDRPAEDFEEAGRRQVLDFSLGSHCINDCLFCVEGGKIPRREVHTPEMVAAALSRSQGPLWVTFAGGEPTLNPAFFDHLRQARLHGAKRISVVSNGCRFTEFSFLQTAIDTGLNELRLSIHGADAATHDALTRRAGSFEDLQQSCAHAKRLRKEGADLTVIVQTCVNTDNLGQLHAMYDLLGRWGVDRWSLNVIEPAGAALARFEALVPPMRKVAEKLKDFIQLTGTDPFPEIRIDSLPACLAPDLRPLLGLRTTIRKPGENGVLEVEEPFRGKVFGPPCQACVERGIRCEGVWNEYVKRHGWEEFETLES